MIFLAFVVGALLGVAANYCADRFGWIPRYRSPWRRVPKALGADVPRPRPFDFFPILGWLPAARFGNNPKISGRESANFWIRPFLVEALFAALAAWRFAFWRDSSALFVGLDAAWAPFGAAMENFPQIAPIIAWAAELALLWTALCATLTDFDDYIIPDELVVPAGAFALVAAGICPFLAACGSTLALWPLDRSGASVTFNALEFAAALGARLGFSDAPGTARALAFVGTLAAFSVWIFALLDRRWRPRLGLRRAIALFCRRLRRAPSTRRLAALWCAGAIWLAVVNFAFSAAAASAVASALLGALVGLAIVWGVRIIGGGALGVEAMGFGDVILMGTIGAFIGWQGALLVFFIAPFFGVVFGLLRRVVNTAPEIPYGPFLCLATLIYLIYRRPLLDFCAPIAGDPIFVVILGAIGFALLAAMLFILRILKSLARR
ncbi:MAG: prepilin peptidase [Thermoguttaceae bacterium]|nr:prepilin peptidase [Thermoguttaceae bacterium]